jgi:hypothetical protein
VGLCHVNGLFPHVKVGLVELFAGVPYRYALRRGQKLLFHLLATLALDRGKKGGTQKAVRGSACGFRPQRKLYNLRGACSLRLRIIEGLLVDRRAQAFNGSPQLGVCDTLKGFGGFLLSHRVFHKVFFLAFFVLE